MNACQTFHAAIDVVGKQGSFFLFPAMSHSLLSLCLCCSDSKVEPLDPPSSCKPGDRVYVEGYEHEKLGGV